MRHRLSRSSVTKALQKGLLPGRLVNGMWWVDGDPPWHRDHGDGSMGVSEYARKYGLTRKQVLRACQEGRLQAKMVHGRRKQWRLFDQPWPEPNRPGRPSGGRFAKHPRERRFMSFLESLRQIWPAGKELNMESLREAFLLWEMRQEESGDILIAHIPANLYQEAWL